MKQTEQLWSNFKQGVFWPYKWLWSILKKLASHPQMQFRDGFGLYFIFPIIFFWFLLSAVIDVVWVVPTNTFQAGILEFLLAFYLLLLFASGITQGKTMALADDAVKLSKDLFEMLMRIKAIADKNNGEARLEVTNEDGTISIKEKSNDVTPTGN